MTSATMTPTAARLAMTTPAGTGLHARATHSRFALGDDRLRQVDELPEIIPSVMIPGT